MLPTLSTSSSSALFYISSEKISFSFTLVPTNFSSKWIFTLKKKTHIHLINIKQIKLNIEIDICYSEIYDIKTK